MLFVGRDAPMYSKIEPFLGGATSARGIKFPPFHAEKRAVLAQGACSTELTERARMCPLFNTPEVTRPQKQNLHGLRARHCAASFVLCRVMRK